MKILRDIPAEKLIKVLIKFGYSITRQKGSHIRLTLKVDNKTHHLTIPNHNPIKIGTLNNIFNDLAEFHKIKKHELISRLFD